MRGAITGLLGLCLVGSACGGNASNACVAGLSLQCAPLYDPPIFQTIFDKTLRPSCGIGTGTCHTSVGAKGGLVFEDADMAYALLLGQADGRSRVEPNDPSCSRMVVRLESSNPTFRMPPGPMALPAAERCAIALWIAGGANR